MRGFLYALARWLGDVESVQRGRYPQRVVRKAVYRATGRALQRWLRF